MNRISIIDRDSIEGIKLIVKSVIYEDFYGTVQFYLIYIHIFFFLN